jgi:hypothetical protein
MCLTNYRQIVKLIIFYLYLILQACTTGNADVADGQVPSSAKNPLPRVRPSAKVLFACQAIGKEPLCRQPASRQSRALDKRSLGQTAADAVHFAESQAIRSSAKTPLCRWSWSSIKSCHVAISQPARTATFADGHVGRTSAKALCRGPSEVLGKERILFCFFFSVFFPRPSYTKYIPTSKVRTILSFCAIFINFFCFFEFFRQLEIELQVHEIMEFIDSKNGIHDVRSMLKPYLRPHMKLKPCWCRNMMSYVREVF